MLEPPHLCPIPVSTSSSTRLQVVSEDCPQQLQPLCPWRAECPREFIFLLVVFGLRTNLYWHKKTQPRWLQLRSDVGGNLYSRTPLQDHSLALLLPCLSFLDYTSYQLLLENISIINHLCVCIFSGFASGDSKPKTTLYSSYLLGRISYYCTPHSLSSRFSLPLCFSPDSRHVPFLGTCLYSLCSLPPSICKAWCFHPFLVFVQIILSQGDPLF